MIRWQLALVLAGVLVFSATVVLARLRLRRARALAAGKAAALAPTNPGSAAPGLTAGAPARPRGAEAPGRPAAEAAPRPEPEAQRTARLDTLRQLHVVAFGVIIAPAASLASSAAHEETTTAIRRALAGIVDKPNYAPRRPLLLPRLMQAMNDDEVSRRELASIIATDPALAGNLLRLANSPFYRIRPEPVESLDRAVALLGLEGMRSLISAALMQPVFRVNGGMFPRFGVVTWDHTLYAANAAEAHAAVLENSDPFAAQLLSLVMGLATIVVFRVATDEIMARRLPPDAAALAALIDAETAAVARQIAASWELSERIDVALADQDAAAGAALSSLGRSLQAGRFIGALALLRGREFIDDGQAQAALQSAGALSGAYERIWSRLRANA